MLLNSSKTVSMCMSLSRNVVCEDILLDDIALDVVPSTKFLGITIDQRLNFSEHVSTVVKKCNSRLYLMRKLKLFSVDVQGLKLFYFSMIRSVLMYGSPAFYSILSKTDQDRLESVQRTATRIMFPSLEGYDNRLVKLDIPTLFDFASTISRDYFNKIMQRNEHPLFGRLIFNTGRTSTRLHATFKPPVCRTEKRKRSFFQHQMLNY